MRSPTRTLSGNLRWTRSGTVWADWLLSPIPYGYRPAKDKKVVRGLHQALLRALPGESLLQGICSGLDAGTVVERMIDGVDLAACPDWAAECEATLDSLDAISPGQRSYWLSVPLGARSTSDRFREPLRSATAGLRDSLALPRSPIETAELTRRLEQARRVAAAIPHLFRPRPATPAQMLWLHLHAQQRGAVLDLDLPRAGSGDLTAELLTARTGASLPEPLLDEGGQSELTRGQLRGWNPTDRRYLKVSQPAQVAPTPASYQSLLVLTDVPAEGMVFPGSEFLGRIDESGLDVDWAVRLQVLGSTEVAGKNRRALVNLNEQYGQREGETSHGLGALDRAARELAEYAAVLESDKFEVEVQPTTIFAVAGPSAASCTDQARALAGFMADAGYKLSQPLGYQTELWWAMQPGTPAGKAVREFAQITTSKALAASVPLASTELGDARGSLAALNISTGRPGVVLHDIAGASARDVSGSLAIAGELGAGKALAIDTPIPTPTGWRAMGELQVGDQVYDETGTPTLVLACSPVMTDRRCLQVMFCDGSTLTADAQHLWTVLTASSPATTCPPAASAVPASGVPASTVRAGEQPGPSPHLGARPPAAGPTRHGPVTGRSGQGSAGGWPDSAAARTVSTLQLQALLLADPTTPPQIPTCGPLQRPKVALPVDPYRLGRTLAAAARNRHGQARSQPQDRAHDQLLQSCLSGSVIQRQALLDGLADTAAGSTDDRLLLSAGTARRAQQLHELLCSLGHRPLLLQHPTGPWRRPSHAPWTLTATSTALIPAQRTGTADHRAATPVGPRPARRVVQVRDVPPVPVRCIRIAAASQLFLAGTAMIATHNSLTLKSLAGGVVDRGGRVIVADRTAMGEYANWARSVTRATVVDIAEPQVSLDPLRLFGTAVGSRVTQSFLTPLLNIAPTSDRGLLLSDVLDPDYLRAHQVHGLGGLLRHLTAGCALPGAAELARAMNVFARRDFGRAIFDESLPVLDPAAPAVVIRTHTLELPTRYELEHQHLFAQLRLEKLYGRAVYALIAALARQNCFADAVPGVFVVDEAHHVTSSPEGEREIIDFVRDGRKHTAAVLLGLHDPHEDLGSPTLRGLIPTRILMRHRDKTLARRGLAWLDLDPDDDELVQLLTEDTSPVTAAGVEEHRRGEALLRDSSGNIGRIKVLPPALPARNAAVRTSPTDSRVPPGADRS